MEVGCTLEVAQDVIESVLIDPDVGSSGNCLLDSDYAWRSTIGWILGLKNVDFPSYPFCGHLVGLVLCLLPLGISAVD